jgi:hypothetical protein
MVHAAAGGRREATPAIGGRACDRWRAIGGTRNRAVLRALAL